MISFKGVSKSYNGKRQVVALNHIDLEIARGEMVSIVGLSGSGKSTLLNLIGGLDRPSAGEIEIDGETLSTLTDDGLTRVRRDKIGFIFQFFNLLPTLSCLENVSLPLHLRGWPRKKVEERARELLDMVKLGARVDHLPDEPTGNLDTVTGAEILKLMHDLHDRLGATILVVTHDKTVAESCPRTIQLLDGRVFADTRRPE